jgi:tetratricopeptide (TPR) repeat protein
MFRFFLFFSLFFVVACKQLDLTSDKIPPLGNTTVRSANQQITFLNEIIAEEPNVPDYYYRRSLILFEIKNNIRALQDINKAIALTNTKSNYFFAKAMVLEALKNYPEALIAAEIAEKKGLKQVDLYLLLSRLYYVTKKPILTVQYLRKIKQIFPKNPDLYYYQGLISYDIEDTLQTIRYMNEAIAMQPAYTNAYKYLFRLRQQKQQPYAALEVLKLAMQQPDLKQDAEMNEMYGDVLLQLKERETAMNWYEKAIALDTTRWQAAQTLGKFHLEERHYELGVSYLQRALKANPKIQGANYLIGLVYDYHLKDFVKAKKAYELALAEQPDNTVIADLVQKMAKRIAYDEYRKSPQFIIDMMRKRQDSIRQSEIVPDNTLPKQ